MQEEKGFFGIFLRELRNLSTAGKRSHRVARTSANHLMKHRKFLFALSILVAQLFVCAPAALAEESNEGSFDVAIDSVMKPVADVAEGIVFFAIRGFPVVLIILASTAIFLTIYFRFINLRGFGVALGTVRGKYTSPDAPGQITHFQALSAALSATVGLGNIAGVAVAIGIGGPGATFWMILIGLCGMTTKFAECTLGVLYRKVAPDGSTRGGAMYYLRDGLAEKGLPGLGKFLAVFFAIMCVAGAIGAGNMFQANQAHQQIHNSFGWFNHGYEFGIVVAILVALVIIGGIVAIARVTSFLVPFMCGTYMLAAITVLIVNAGNIPDAIGIIIREAFNFSAAGGAVVGAVLIQGIKRGVFSNEAGVGSAPIAHSAVKTDRPASEGLVALLEPFIDTVVVCTMTALVIVTTGMWNVKADTKESNTPMFAAAEDGAATIGELEADEKLRFAGGKKVGWYEVSSAASEKPAWIQVESITELSTEVATALYSSPEKGGKSVGNLASGEEITFVELATSGLLKRKKDGWYKVVASDGKTTGWVETSTLRPTETRAAATPLFEKPEAGAEKIGELGAAEPVLFAGGIGIAWYEVTSFDDTKTGWVRAEAITLQDDGIWLTSEAFGTVIGWFPYVLAIAVFLFAFSTMISWSYYAEQAVIYLFGDNKGVIIAYKLVFCGFIIVGAAASLGNVIRLADALFFCMVIPNLVGVYVLLPKVKEQLTSYLAHVRSVDGKGE